MNNSRIDYIDALKGFAILLMVMGHSLSWQFADYPILFTDANPSVDFIKATVIHDFIYSFHMPLFFMLSGYFMHIKRGIWGTILNKSRRLLVPYVATGFILFLLRGYFGYWFLLSLWGGVIMSIPFLYFQLRILKKGSLLLELSVAFVYWFVIYKISRIDLFYFPWFDISKGFNFCYFYLFLLGIIMQRHKSWVSDKNDKYQGTILIVFLLLFIVKYIPDYGVTTVILTKFRVFLLPIFGSLFFFSFFKRDYSSFSPNIKKILSKMGSYSLEIYIIHIFFVIQIPQVGSFWLTTNFETCLASQIVYSLFTSLIAIFISLAIAFVLKKSSLLNAALFGSN